VTKQQIRQKFTVSETTLTNDIKALRDRKIILPKEGLKGVYRLQDKGFAWWIMLICRQEKENTENK